MSDGHLSIEEISAYLDGERDLEEAARDHLRACADCSRLHREQLELRRLARETAPPVPTEEMWNAIRGKIGEEPAAAARPRWNIQLGAAIGGALAAAAISFVVFRDPAERGITVPPVTEGRPPGGAPAQGRRDGTATVASAPEAKPRPAPEQGRARRKSASRADKAAPAADAPRAPEAESAAEPSAERATAAAPQAARTEARPVFRAALYTLTADAISGAGTSLVRASGRVVVAPRTPGVPYVATVDGLTRTLTGAVSGLSAEIANPGQSLSLTTRPAK